MHPGYGAPHRGNVPPRGRYRGPIEGDRSSEEGVRQVSGARDPVGERHQGHGSSHPGTHPGMAIKGCVGGSFFDMAG